jgi:hypothetical protein
VAIVEIFCRKLDFLNEEMARGTKVSISVTIKNNLALILISFSYLMFIWKRKFSSEVTPRVRVGRQGVFFSQSHGLPLDFIRKS